MDFNEIMEASLNVLYYQVKISLLYYSLNYEQLVNEL